MYYLDLFHGIGGFALGAYWAGMKFDAHYCSDIEPYCQKLYKLRFPDSIQLGDITQIETDKLPKGEWIITGGFPCQDISIAGKGAGIHGARSGLWFEYLRLIRDLRPRFAIMENVGMLIRRGLREVLGSLAEIGYDAEWQDIRASDMGAPHRRERIWIVAYSKRFGRGAWRAKRQGQRRCFTLDGAGCEKSDTIWIECENCGDESPSDIWLSEGECPDCGFIPKLSRVQEQNWKIQAGRAVSVISNNVADTEGREPRDQAEHEGRENISGGSEEISNTDNQRSQRRECQELRECPGERITGTFGSRRHGCDWSTEPAVCRMVDGLPAEFYGYEGRLAVKSYQRVDRLKGLGNAIVPQIAELLFTRIKEL